MLNPANTRLTIVMCVFVLVETSGCVRSVVVKEHLPKRIIEAEAESGIATHKLLEFRRSETGLIVTSHRSQPLRTGPIAVTQETLRPGESFSIQTCVNGGEDWHLERLSEDTAEFVVHGEAFRCITDKLGRLHGRVYDQQVELRFPPPTSWWFPFFTPTGTQQSFDITVSDDVTIGDRSWNITDHARLTVDLLPAPGRGCIVQIVKPENLAENGQSRQNQILQWVQGWSERNPDGLTVTPDRLLVNGADVLRGPWHKGDRFTIGGFGAIFFVFYLQAVGFTHWEVTNVSATGADLHAEFWFGESGPAVRGSGDAAFRNDANGLTRIDAGWQRSDGHETHKVKLTAERSAILPGRP